MSLYVHTRAYVYIYAGASREALILIVYSVHLAGYIDLLFFYHLFVQIDDILLCQLAANRSRSSMNERGKNTCKEDINNLLLRLVAIRH